MCTLYAESIKGETQFLESLKATRQSPVNVLDACKGEIQELEASENELESDDE